jgi:hypothetical protein
MLIRIRQAVKFLGSQIVNSCFGPIESVEISQMSYIAYLASWLPYQRVEMKQ